MASVTVGAVSIDTSGLDQKLKTIQRDQLPYAKMLALNNLAFGTAYAERRAMKTVFDRPTKWIKQSVNVAKKATKKDLTAAVWIGEALKNKEGKALFQSVQTDRITGILIPHIDGGARIARKSEKRLRRIGVLGSGEWLVAARSAPRDRYGNIPWTEYQSMLQSFRGYTRGGFNRHTGEGTLESGVAYWVTDLSGGIRGIFRTKYGGSPTLIWILARKTPTYKKRFDFFGIAQRYATIKGPGIAQKAVDKAMATAR